MDKKTLGIILGVLIVAVAGVAYFGYQRGLFTKEGAGGALPGGGVIPGGGIIQDRGPAPEGGVIPDSGGSTQPEPTTGGQEKPIVSGKMTDEICIELMAHYFYSSFLTAKQDLVTGGLMVEKAEALEKKYGVTEDDYDEICNAKAGDSEFMDKVGKRMQELGFKVE